MFLALFRKNKKKMISNEDKRALSIENRKNLLGFKKDDKIGSIFGDGYVSNISINSFHTDQVITCQLKNYVNFSTTSDGKRNESDKAPAIWLLEDRVDNEIKIGETVVRMLAGKIPMDLIISDITDNKIICGAYEFDIRTGAEIDDELGWGNDITGSYLELPRNKDNSQ